VFHAGRRRAVGTDGAGARSRLLRALSVTLVALVALAVLVARTAGRSPQQSPEPGPVAASPGVRADAACNAPGRERVTQYAGRWTTRINDPYPPPDRTYDLRNLRHVGYGTTTRYAITIANPGAGWTSSRMCLLGGTVLSSVDRGRNWEDLENNYNGDGLDIGIESDWAVVDGLRIDNTFDGIAAQGPSKAELIVRNVHLSDIRDDCIENDDQPKSLTVQDSLLDGCFTGISERPGAETNDLQAGATTTLDGVLLHVKPQAFGTDCRHPEACADGKAAFGLFKWSTAATSRVIIRNSVLRVDRYSAYGPSEMSFPPGTTAENSILVWLGPGLYPAPLPPGLEMTTDVTVWERARAQWLCRHGRREC
jgi:hypothetical protein